MSNLVKKGQAGLMSPEDIQVLKDSMFKGFTDVEVKFCLAVSNQLGLSPLVRQIHFVKRWNSQLQRDVITPQTGIDGFRLTADRTKKYAGSDEPIFEYAEDDKVKKQPIKSTTTVYKIVHGMRQPFTASARWDEFFPSDAKLAFMWKGKPHVMLSKCSEANALRKAFPAELSNVYADEEMQNVDAIEEKAKRIEQEITRQAESNGATVKDAKYNIRDVTSSNNVGPEEQAPVSNGNPTEPASDVGDFESFDKPEGDYVVTAGDRFKGKKLREINKDHLENYCRGRRKWFKDNKIEIKNGWLELLTNASKYLGKEL